MLNAALALNGTKAGRERREIGHYLSAPVDNVDRFALGRSAINSGFAFMAVQLRAI